MAERPFKGCQPHRGKQQLPPFFLASLVSAAVFSAASLRRAEASRVVSSPVLTSRPRRSGSGQVKSGGGCDGADTVAEPAALMELGLYLTADKRLEICFPSSVERPAASARPGVTTKTSKDNKAAGGNASLCTDVAQPP